MITAPTPETENAATITIHWDGLIAALLAALARLAFVVGIGVWVVILLMNEVAAALVYVIAAVLALFFWSCSLSPPSSASDASTPSSSAASNFKDASDGESFSR